MDSPRPGDMDLIVKVFFILFADMNAKQKKQLGVTLGVVLIVLVILHLRTSIRSGGDTNWYFLVMLCGMALLLYYTFYPKRKKKRRKR